MHTIWILSLEPIETRYTAQWFAGVPQQIAAHAEAQGIAARVHMDPARFGPEAIDGGVLNIVNVPGDGGTQRASTGAFLNFATTNLWKNQQVNRFIGMVEADLVRDGDKVLVTDAWHPGILQLAYMRDLLKVSWDISAIWHAGSYDPWDFLGRAITDKRWSLLPSGRCSGPSTATSSPPRSIGACSPASSRSMTTRWATMPPTAAIPTNTYGTSCRRTACRPSSGPT